jgi:hypothetical protein
MKKLIILLSLLFAPYLFSSDIKKFFQVNEESKCSFVLIVIDEEDKHFFADFKIDQLKKCEFPVGPIRNNEISCSDFSTISEDVMFKINELVQQKQAIELPVFCIDGSPDITKPRSCLFELDKSKLSYVFNFDDHPIKEMHGIIMKDSDLHQLYDGDDNNSNDVDDDEIDKETEDVNFLN